MSAEKDKTQGFSFQFPEKEISFDREEKEETLQILKDNLNKMKELQNKIRSLLNELSDENE